MERRSSCPTTPKNPRQLPANPDLRHLKDQPKNLLKAGRADSLGRAQVQIARQYGFASRGKLKTHVESSQLAGQLKQAIGADDVETVRRVPAHHAGVVRPGRVGGDPGEGGGIAAEKRGRRSRHSSR